jgi:hypothetical protein
MAAENCDHGHAAPRELIESLPHSQAGYARHRCAVCAYDMGRAEGFRAGLEEARRRAERSAKPR